MNKELRELRKDFEISKEAKQLLNLFVKEFLPKTWPAKYKSWPDYCKTENIESIEKMDMELFACFCITKLKQWDELKDLQVCKAYLKGRLEDEQQSSLLSDSDKKEGKK